MKLSLLRWQYLPLYLFLKLPRPHWCFWLFPALRGFGAFGSAIQIGFQGRGMDMVTQWLLIGWQCLFQLCHSLTWAGGEVSVSQHFFEELSSAPAQFCVLACHCCSRALSSTRTQQRLFSLQFAARTGKYHGNFVCSACQLFKENWSLQPWNKIEQNIAEPYGHQAA